MDSSFREFSHDDHAYQRWLHDNPKGYVVNTPRQKPVSYMVLHRAGCYSISHYNRMARPGGFTERQYIKICSDSIEGLRNWARANGRPDGSFSGVCRRCKP